MGGGAAGAGGGGLGSLGGEAITGAGVGRLKLGGGAELGLEKSVAGDGM
jgi:hypothetical protein